MREWSETLTALSLRNDGSSQHLRWPWLRFLGAKEN
jgi:hypothetical protein